MARKLPEVTESGTLRPITVRNLPPPLARAVREHAAKYDVSLNKAVIQLVEKSLGLVESRGDRAYDDLDGVIGAWTRSQTRAAERLLAEQRRIEPEMWR